MIKKSQKITAHFHSTEFRCKCGCGKIYIEKKLVENLEKLFDKLNASKCIISSGYRCPSYDKSKKIGGNGKGQHTKGKASDCVYYDKKGKIIPSKIVVCVAYDSKLFNGIAKIDKNYVHLDTRILGKYRGDETKGNASYWTNPYDYFKVTKEEVAKYTGEEVKKEEPKKDTTKYLSNKTYKGSSIVEALKQIKINSSYSYRSKLAKANGITNYKGTASQNTKLLKLLKQGKLKSA